MREGADSTTLAGAAGWRPVVSSWRGTTLLANSVPVLSGRLTADVAQEVPERLTLTVPEYADSTSWVPDSPDHPLAKFGQFLEVSIDVTSATTGVATETRLGRFQVQEWDHDDDARLVHVECVGLLQRAAEARFRAPEVPRSTGTFASEIARLMVPGVGVVVSDDLVDRAVPQSFMWDSDRLSALYDLADAWPARLRVDQNGTLQVLAPLGADPDPVVLELSDGDGGTVISAPTRDGRDQVYNVVVAKGAQTDDPAVQPVRAEAVATGNLDPNVYGEVVAYYASPLIVTLDEVQAAANKKLADYMRGADVRVVRCAPDPRVELDDAVSVTRAGVTQAGWVVGYDLPLTVAGGDMTIRVGVSS